MLEQLTIAAAALLIGLGVGYDWGATKNGRECAPISGKYELAHSTQHVDGSVTCTYTHTYGRATRTEKAR